MLADASPFSNMTAKAAAHRPAAAHALRHAFLLLCLVIMPLPASGGAIIDQLLKQRLVEALAGNNAFGDRFDAEVWLVDMAQRLKGRIGNENRRTQLLKHVHFEASQAKLPPELVLAVIQVESNFDRFAISEAGARGLMQIMPFWLEEIGRPDDNLFEVDTNLRFGCTILRYYLDMEGGDLQRALARYNGSLGSTRYPNKVFDALSRRWHR